MERMDDGCVGFGEWLKIDQANGGGETEATGQCPGKEAAWLPVSSVLQGASIFCFLSNTHGLPSAAF